MLDLEQKPLASSRIFVRGLPPNISQEQFRNHFSSQSAVTDIRLIPHRRIGYVGYKTPEEAVKAVKYFNKSYIRMSRIFVEIARPVGSESLPRSGSELQKRYVVSNSTSPPPTVTTNSVNERGRKRKRDGEDRPDTEPRLREFLEVMKGPSKSRTWANQHALREPEVANLQVQEPSAEINMLSEGPHDTMSAPRPVHNAAKKTELPAARRPQLSKEEPQDSIEAQSPSGASATDPASNERDAKEQTQPMIPVSDTDWLRSRTKRLLDLEDNEDESPTAPTAPGTEEVAALRKTQLESSPVLNKDIVMDGSKNSGEAPIGDPSSDSFDKTFERGNPRLFVRNLPYSTTETEVRERFSSYGELTEVHLPTSADGSTKGFAYVSYADPECVLRAYRDLDGTSFQGRIVHILPAAPKVEKKLDEFALSKLPLKKQKQIRRKAEAASSVFNWNSLYMSTDAVMSSIADRLQISKSDLLDPTSSDAAVKQAHAETHIIQETKAYFESNGVDLEAFDKQERGDTAILVKNFPYGTKASELKSTFEEYGRLSRMLVPPAGTIAIVEYAEAAHARTAFASLAYRRFKDSILFLEKAPKGLFRRSEPNTQGDGATVEPVQPKPSTTELLENAAKEESIDTNTLFVRNLNFSTTTARLTENVKAFDGFLSARVKTKPDPKRPGQTLSMGFGFLEFQTKSQAQAACSALDGYNLDGHKLLVRAAHRPLDAGEETRKADLTKKVVGRNTKIIIKNLPFEASKKEVRALFGSYGQLRSVRVPKKFDSSARGFAFAEFVTAREAENAIEALKHTHLLGRRLVLEFAAESSVDAEQELQKMQEKVGKQTHRVALQRLMGTGRQKFAIEDDAVL